MIKAPNSEKLLNKTQEYLEQYTLQETKPDPKDRLRELLIPALKNSRNIQNSLYGWHPPHGKGILRSFKNFLMLKFKMLTINVLEKTVNRQQKYNEALYQAIDELQQENIELQQKLAKLENKSND